MAGSKPLTPILRPRLSVANFESLCCMPSRALLEIPKHQNARYDYPMLTAPHAALVPCHPSLPDPFIHLRYDYPASAATAGRLLYNDLDLRVTVSPPPAATTASQEGSQDGSQEAGAPAGDITYWGNGGTSADRVNNVERVGSGGAHWGVLGGWLWSGGWEWRWRVASFLWRWSCSGGELVRVM